MNNLLTFKTFNECPKIVRKALRRMGYSETTNFTSIAFVRRENDRDGVLRNKFKSNQYIEKYDGESDSYVLLLMTGAT